MRSAKVLAGIWSAAIAFGFLQHWASSTNLGVHLRIDRLGIAEYVPCFLAGVTAYYLSIRRREFTLPFWCWPAVLASATILYWRWGAYAPGKAYVGWVCCLLIGLWVVQCRESDHGWLNKLTHNIAKYSYGLYLGQVPVLWLAFVKLGYLSSLTQWTVFVGLIILVPLAAYHLIEKPCIRLGMVLTSPRVKQDIEGVLPDPSASLAYGEASTNS